MKKTRMFYVKKIILKKKIKIKKEFMLRCDTAPQGLKIDEIIDFEILVDLNSKIYYESNKTGIIHI